MECFLNLLDPLIPSDLEDHLLNLTGKQWGNMEGNLHSITIFNYNNLC